MPKVASLVIDIGTGSSRVAIVSESLNIINMKSIANIYYVDNAYNDGQYFIPSELQVHIKDLVREVLRESSEYSIKFITASAARESLVLLDKDGHAFYGLPNIDNRGKDWIAEIKGRDYIERVTGRPLTEDFGAMKLYGLQKKQEALFNSIHKIISLSDWIGYLFTGEIEMEYSQASETQLFNIYSKSWDSILCKKFFVDMNILPELVASGSERQLKTEIKDEYRLREDCIFIVGGADTQLASVGMDLQEGEIGLISGTSSPIVTYKKNIPDYEKNKDFNFWCSCNLSGKGYQIETNPGVTGLNLQMAKDNLLPEFSYEDLDTFAQKNANNLKCIASFTTQSPYKNISFPNGGFLTSVPFLRKLTTKDLLVGILADIAFAVAFKIRQNEVLSQNESSVIVGCGGTLRLKSLCQMIADLTGKKLILKKDFSESSIIGGAKVCFSGVYTNRINTSQVIQEFVPKENYYLKEKLKEWLIYKEKINSKKEIGAF